MAAQEKRVSDGVVSSPKRVSSSKQTATTCSLWVLTEDDNVCRAPAVVELVAHDKRVVLLCAKHRKCLVCRRNVISHGFMPAENGVVCYSHINIDAKCAVCSRRWRTYERSSELTALDPFGAVWLCHKHDCCIACERLVRDSAFVVMDAHEGVACSEPGPEGSSCSFRCGACERMCLSTERNEDWNDRRGDGLLRCRACSGQCATCGEQSDKGMNTFSGVDDDRHFVCTRCSPAAAAWVAAANPPQ